MRGIVIVGCARWMARREATQDARHEVSSNYAPPRTSNFRFELLMNDSYRKIGTDSAIRINSIRSINGIRSKSCALDTEECACTQCRDDNTWNN